MRLIFINHFCSTSVFTEKYSPWLREKGWCTLCKNVQVYVNLFCHKAGVLPSVAAKPLAVSVLESSWAYYEYYVLGELSCAGK